jgi:quinol monooxygenase YgiN
MYVSRLSFHSLPGKTHDVEQALKTLLDLVTKTAGTQARVLRTHFASLGAPDVVFEQESQDLATLESQIQHVTESPEFQQWTTQMSAFLSQSPKREVYLIVEPTQPSSG